MARAELPAAVGRRRSATSRSSPASRSRRRRRRSTAATRSRPPPGAACSRRAEQISFTPNQLARSLLAGRTGTVGLLTSDLEGRFVIPILMGAEDAFGAGQVNVFLCDARGDAIREQHHLKALLSRRVDGIIVVGRQTDPRPSLGQDLPVPVVYAYAPSDDPADLSLTPDNHAGGRLAVEHLHRLRPHAASRTSRGDPAYAAAQDRARRRARRRSRRPGSSSSATPMFSEWSEHWGRDAAGDAARAASRRRRHRLRLRPDRARRARHDPRPRPPRARRHRRHRLRQLGGAHHQLAPRAHEHRRQPAAARTHRRPACLRRRSTTSSGRAPTTCRCGSSSAGRRSRAAEPRQEIASSTRTLTRFRNECTSTASRRLPRVIHITPASMSPIVA